MTNVTKRFILLSVPTNNVLILLYRRKSNVSIM
ncbi:hypothetical protein VPHK406_0080 [Vibrio phage K406]